MAEPMTDAEILKTLKSVYKLQVADAIEDLQGALWSARFCPDDINRCCLNVSYAIDNLSMITTAMSRDIK